MIGKVLCNDFFSNRYCPVAYAMVIIMLAILVLQILLFHHYRY